MKKKLLYMKILFKKEKKDKRLRKTTHTLLDCWLGCCCWLMFIFNEIWHQTAVASVAKYLYYQTLLARVQVTIQTDKSNKNHKIICFFCIICLVWMCSRPTDQQKMKKICKTETEQKISKLKYIYCRYVDRHNMSGWMYGCFW